MKSILAYIPILTLLIFTIGCNAENPICTTNFCAVGEVFPRSELDTADFSEVDIDDSVIFATLVGVPTPVEATPVNPVQTPVPVNTNGVQTFADIISDVAANKANSVYLEQTVTITATVRFNLFVSDNRGGITLKTNNNDVIFYITDFDNPESLQKYNEEQIYTFTVYIRNVVESNTRRGLWLIFSHEIKEN